MLSRVRCVRRSGVTGLCQRYLGLGDYIAEQLQKYIGEASCSRHFVTFVYISGNFPEPCVIISLTENKKMPACVAAMHALEQIISNKAWRSSHIQSFLSVRFGSPVGHLQPISIWQGPYSRYTSLWCARVADRLRPLHPLLVQAPPGMAGRRVVENHSSVLDLHSGGWCVLGPGPALSDFASLLSETFSLSEWRIRSRQRGGLVNS